MGCSVGMPRAGSPSVDLLVANESGTRLLPLQVKTANRAWRERKRSPETSYWEWDVGVRSRTLRDKNLFYAFVDLHWGKEPVPAGFSLWPPDVFIVPSPDVAEKMDREGIKRYMYYIYRDEAPKYRERWDVLAARLKD